MMTIHPLTSIAKRIPGIFVQYDKLAKGVLPEMVRALEKKKLHYKVR